MVWKVKVYELVRLLDSAAKLLLLGLTFFEAKERYSLFAGLALGATHYQYLF
jgi:hypothetical protein